MEITKPYVEPKFNLTMARTTGLIGPRVGDWVSVSLSEDGLEFAQVFDSGKPTIQQFAPSTPQFAAVTQAVDGAQQVTGATRIHARYHTLMGLPFDDKVVETSVPNSAPPIPRTGTLRDLPAPLRAVVDAIAGAARDLDDRSLRRTTAKLLRTFGA